MNNRTELESRPPTAPTQNMQMPQAFTPPPTTPGQTMPHAFKSDQQKLIDDIFKNNLASQQQKLTQQRDTKLQGLTGLQTAATQGAYKQRNAADVLSVQNAQRLKELMAGQGLLQSGDNVDANARLLASRQNAQNDINQTETNTLTDIEGQRALINNNASAEDLALMQELQAQQAGQSLDLGYKDAQHELDVSDRTGNLYGQRTLAGGAQDFNQFDRNRSFDYQSGQDQIQNDAQYGGVYNGNQTATQKNADRSFDYNAKRDRIEDAKWGIDRYGYGGPKDDAGVFFEQYQGAKTIQEQTSLLQQEGARLGNELTKLNLQSYPEEQRLRIQQLTKQIAEIGKAPYQSASDKRMDELRIETAQLELDRLQNPPAPKGQTAEEYAKYIDGTPGLTTKDEYTGAVTVNKEAAERMILASGLPESEMIKLYQRYQIATGR